MSGIHLVNLINVPDHKYVHGIAQSRFALKNANRKNILNIQGENDKLPSGTVDYKYKVELEKTKQRKAKYNRRRRKKIEYIIKKSK
jgi:hypothetical protein